MNVFCVCSSKQSNSHGREKDDVKESVKKIEASTDESHLHIKEDKVCLIINEYLFSLIRIFKEETVFPVPSVAFNFQNPGFIPAYSMTLFIGMLG
jgi:hypothetical protein